MSMNTKEAIEFLNDLQDDYEELQEEGNNKGILEVIKLLEMLEEIGRVYDISHFKQKYFPEPKERLVELVKKMDREVRELLNMLGG